MVDQLLQGISDWLFDLPAISIYAMLFIIAYTENIIPPLPGDLLIVVAGYLAAEGVIQFFPTLALSTLGSVFGFMTLYTLGWFWGDEIKLKKNKFWMFRFVGLKYYARVKIWMNRWGQGVILANRFLAGTRSIISLTAGITQTRADYTVASSAISSLLWNGILLTAGWIIKENWEIIGRYLDIYGLSIGVLVVLFILGIMIRKRRKKKATVR